MNTRETTVSTKDSNIYVEGGTNKSVGLALELPHIIHLANSVINGYLNYYSFVYNRSRLTGYIVLYNQRFRFSDYCC